MRMICDHILLQHYCISVIAPYNHSINLKNRQQKSSKILIEIQICFVLGVFRTKNMINYIVTFC